jgi:RES domain-containing protein
LGRKKPLQKYESKSVRPCSCALARLGIFFKVVIGELHLEVAVHKGFPALDKTAHVITAVKIDDPALVHVVQSGDVPNPAWLLTGVPSAGQQEFGAALLAEHVFVAIPSVVSQHSWNLVFDPDRAAGRFAEVLQEPLSIDTRLNPPTAHS